MKLRNKKTGEIGFLRCTIEPSPEKITVVECIDGRRGSRAWYYDTLAELNEEWEDYKPVEPLIKDERITLWRGGRIIMMPNCNYKGCHKAAEVVLGKINTKDEEDEGRPHPVIALVCEKHAKEILKKLCLEPWWKEEE